MKASGGLTVAENTRPKDVLDSFEGKMTKTTVPAHQLLFWVRKVGVMT